MGLSLVADSPVLYPCRSCTLVDGATCERGSASDYHSFRRYDASGQAIMLSNGEFGLHM